MSEEDDIRVDLYKFAEIVGITLDEAELLDNAYDYCEMSGYEGEDLDRCIDRFFQISKEGVVEASRDVFEFVNLDIRYEEEKGEVIISPSRYSDWEDAGKAIAEIVDGYMGIVWSPDQTKYETFKEMNEPTDDRKLVEDHLHWVRGYPELYGQGNDPSRRYDDVLEAKIRYHF